MKAVYVIVGLLVALYGGFYILLVFAFSTLTDPNQPDAAQDAEQWRILTREFPSIGFGIVLIVWGLYLMFSRPKP